MPSEYPRITNGLGKFTPEVFNRLMLMLQAFEEKKRRSDSQITEGNAR